MGSENLEIYSKHSSRQFNDELESLRTDLLTMGGNVERQVAEAMEALMNSDEDLAESARALDNETNALEKKIYAKSTQIIARRQPAAVDLRLLVSINRAVVDLERIGDEATRIAKYAIELSSADGVSGGLREVRHISELVSEMLKDVLTAFARLDMDLAFTVVKRDPNVDEEYTSAIRSLITYMMEDQRNISHILNVIWVLRSLERIGDHACNLAEHLVYQVSGEDVSHSSIDEIGEAIQDV